MSLPSRSAVCYTRNMHIRFCAVVMLFIVDCIIQVAVTCKGVHFFSHFIWDHFGVCTCWRKPECIVFFSLTFVLAMFFFYTHCKKKKKNIHQCKDETDKLKRSSLSKYFNMIMLCYTQTISEMWLAEHICLYQMSDLRNKWLHDLCNDLQYCKCTVCS